MTSKGKSSESKKALTAASQPPQWTEYLCCSVCDKDFNRTDRCPISLGCGHTFCRACIRKLKQPQCQFDQTPITCNIVDLPTNSALLQLLPGDSEKPLPSLHSHEAGNISQYLKNYENAKACIEELALYLKPGKSGDLSRPMQRKLVALINCQLFEDEGRKRALRASRALGERTATELILLHQNPTTLSASLWAAVRARGCQFLGPAMQEEALKLIHLALEDGSELSRKVLVQIVVKNLQTQFSQASKTSIGHVVQLLYRASCFKVTKRDGESSLMRLKEEFLMYEDLRKEHDTQIVQIAREAGLRIAPDQWSALLYGDQVHKSHMQSIIDRLQSGVSFSQCIADLTLALQRSNDPGNIQSLLLHFKFLSELDMEQPLWDALEKSTYSVKVCVKELIEFMKNHHHWLWQCQDATQQTSKYKTSMCRDSKNKGICPRGQSCTFAHSEAELQHYRNRRKKGGQIPFTPNEFRSESNNSGNSSHSNVIENPEVQRAPMGAVNVPPTGHVCQCGNTISHPYNNSPMYYHDHMHAAQTHHSQPLVAPSHHSQPPVTPSHHSQSPVVPSLHSQPPAPPSHHSQTFTPPNVISHTTMQPNQTMPRAISQQVAPAVTPSNMHHQQPPQVHYVAGNSVMYEAKPGGPTGYESVHVMPNGPPTTQSHYAHQSLPVAAAIEIQNSSKPIQGRVVQPNQYIPVVHRQQSPTYVHPNQVQDPMLPPHHPGTYQVPQSPYACLTLQNGQQMALPAAPPPTFRPEVVQQSPMVFQQHPPLQVQTMPPAQPMNYQSSVVIPAALQQNIMSPPPPVVPVKQNEAIVAPAMLSTFVVPSEEIAVVPQPNCDQYRVVMPAPIDSSASLAELKHRKDEVINKLVKKRIVAPKVEEKLQHCVSDFSDRLIDEEFGNGSGDGQTIQKPEYLAVLLDPTSYVGNIMTTTAAANRPVYNGKKTSNGHYSLWEGTTCIPSLSSFSSWDEVKEQNMAGIDVVSGLDTSTSQVAAFQDDSSYVGKCTHSCYISSSKMTSLGQISSEDEIMSIQDQRIVSKYGPIARTVRSKTTSAIPEQVTANANGATHPFLSDKKRSKTNFVAGDQNQNLMCVRSEVEPTAVSISSRKLPDLVSTSYTYYSTPSNYTLEQPQADSPEENEDLMLAIELQQIEMGIQKIQRDAKSK